MSAPQAESQLVPAPHEMPPTATTNTLKRSKLVLEVSVQSCCFDKVINRQFQSESACNETYLEEPQSNL